MSDQKTSFLRRNLYLIAGVSLLGGYVLISGKTGSCSACVAITQFAGITPKAAAETPKEPLKEGDSIPSGTLRTSSGDSFDFPADLSGQPIVLIFYRGGWCPFCSRHLAALSDIAGDLSEAGFRLLAISPDRPEILTAKEDLSELPYTLLSDSTMTWTKQFGIAFRVEDELVNKYKNSYNIDLEADSGQTHHLLPHPSVYIVDAEGTIRFTYVNENYKVRLDPDEILAAVKKISG